MCCLVVGNKISMEKQNYQWIRIFCLFLSIDVLPRRLLSIVDSRLSFIHHHVFIALRLTQAFKENHGWHGWHGSVLSRISCAYRRFDLYGFMPSQVGVLIIHGFRMRKQGSEALRGNAMNPIFVSFSFIFLSLFSIFLLFLSIDILFHCTICLFINK